MERVTVELTSNQVSTLKKTADAMHPYFQYALLAQPDLFQRNMKVVILDEDEFKMVATFLKKFFKKYGDDK